MGLALVGRGLIGRTPRVPECRHCRHDLTGIDALRCPECGRTARSARELRRRRLRPFSLAVGLLGVTAGVVGLTRDLPAAWWLARTPTLVLIHLAGRYFDEPMQRDIAAALEDRITTSDGVLAWNEFGQFGPWKQELIRDAIVRIEATLPSGETCNRLRRLADMPAALPDFALQPPLDVWLPDTPSELLKRLQSAMRAAPDLTSDLPDARSTALVRELHAIGIPYADEIPIGDNASAYVELVPCEGPGASANAVMRFGLSDFEGVALWFRREPDGRWRVAAPPRPTQGRVAYRAGPDNVRAYAADDTAYLMESMHLGGGSGFVNERLRVVDLSRASPVLDVPKSLSRSFSGEGASLVTALRWPTTPTVDALDLEFEVVHERDDAAVARAAGVIRHRRGAHGGFRATEIRWTTAPPGAPDLAQVPLFPLIEWETTAAERAAVHGLPESAFEPD